MDELRDQFAIAAMQGLLSTGRIKDRELVASAAYEQADAMIAEREKDDIETNEKIKKMLVVAIDEKYPGVCTGSMTSAKHLIFQLKTGMPF